MLIRFECDAVELACIKDLVECGRRLLSSKVNSSFHVWEVLWDFCQLRVAFQVQIPSNSYLQETVWERLKLIVTQVQILSNKYLREAFRERLELIVTLSGSSHIFTKTISVKQMTRKNDF
jgi:hypothetical protein